MLVLATHVSINESQFDHQEPAAFRRLLLRWYSRHKRDLPWRQDRNPYRVWVSEIMLQQTRVAAVMDHYQKFLRRFPTVKKLAAANEADVLAAWSGLGYYRRARMLRSAALIVVEQCHGQVPSDVASLRSLPGIGRYSAAAIASIAFGEPLAVVDGNVERVLSRLSGRQLPQPAAWSLAEKLLHRQRPGDFNQAMMELGATICLPAAPICSACPVFSLCKTRGRLPAMQKPSRARRAVIHYSLHHRNGSVLLVQRAKNASLMPGMWELPELPVSSSPSNGWFKLRHSITVTNYEVRVYPDGTQSANGQTVGVWKRNSELSKLALTGLARKILRAAKVIEFR